MGEAWDREPAYNCYLAERPGTASPHIVVTWEKGLGRQVDTAAYLGLRPGAVSDAYIGGGEGGGRRHAKQSFRTELEKELGESLLNIRKYSRIMHLGVLAAAGT